MKTIDARRNIYIFSYALYIKIGNEWRERISCKIFARVKPSIKSLIPKGDEQTESIIWKQSITNG